VAFFCDEVVEAEKNWNEWEKEEAALVEELAKRDEEAKKNEEGMIKLEGEIRIKEERLRVRERELNSKERLLNLGSGLKRDEDERQKVRIFSPCVDFFIEI
jgi:hypothetical protein